MTRKQGVSPDLFIWIFALVAGALLFLFFILWSGRHAETSSTLEDIEFLRSLEQHISVLSTTDELSKTIVFPRQLDVHVDCTTFFTGRATEQSTLFLFTPSLLQRQKYTLVGFPWRFPFFLDMFYALVPEQSMVFLFYEPSATAFVTSLDLPSTLPVKTLPLSSFSLSTIQQQLQGYSRVTLVFFGTVPDSTSLLARLRSLPVTVLAVDHKNSLLTFYPSGRQLPYYGEALLAGAFFGPEQYACHSKRALDRFHLLTTLYQQKVALLQQKLETGSSCHSFFSQTNALLTTLSTAEDKDQLHALVASLQTLQEEVTRYDCPQIY